MATKLFKFGLGRSAWYMNTAAWDAWIGPGTTMQSGFLSGAIGMLPPFVAAFQGLVKCLVITLAMLAERAPKMNRIIPGLIREWEEVAHETIFKRCQRVDLLAPVDFGRMVRYDLDSLADALDELVDQHASVIDELFPGGGSLVPELASLHRLSLHMRFCLQSTFGSSYADCPEIVANVKHMTDFMEILSTWSACMANKLEQAEQAEVRAQADTGSAPDPVIELTVIDEDPRSDV